MHFVRAVLKHTIAHGIEPLALLRSSGIAPRLLREPQARISIERFADLQVATMLAMRDEALGYYNRPLPLGSWAMMCHAVIGSATLGHALSRYCRFYGLFDLSVTPRFTQDSDTAVVGLQRRPEAVVDPYLAELLLFNTHRFASWLVQEHVPIQQATLDYAPVAEADDYRMMFLGNPVTFEQSDCTLSFSAALMDRPVMQSEQSLARFLRHPALIMLTQHYRRSSWTAKVREIVRGNLRDMPELPGVAEQLQLHPQTLRRRLAAEGTTFTDIKNQLRRDIALHYLGRHGLSIEEIAYRAGFSEASAFIRAFKGWTGITPYSYRKGL